DRALGRAREEAQALSRPTGHPAPLLLSRRPPLRARFRAQGHRDRLRGGEARGRRQRALRFSRLSLRAGAEDALSALLQAAACSLALFRPRIWHRAWAEALLVDPIARDTTEPTARASLRGAASADSVGGQRSDDRRRAARFLSLRRHRLQRRGRSGGAIWPQGVDVLDRLRLRCRVRDAV